MDLGYSVSDIIQAVDAAIRLYKLVKTAPEEAQSLVKRLERSRQFLDIRERRLAECHAQVQADHHVFESIRLEYLATIDDVSGFLAKFPSLLEQKSPRLRERISFTANESYNKTCVKLEKRISEHERDLRNFFEAVGINIQHQILQRTHSITIAVGDVVARLSPDLSSDTRLSSVAMEPLTAMQLPAPAIPVSDASELDDDMVTARVLPSSSSASISFTDPFNGDALNALALSNSPPEHDFRASHRYSSSPGSVYTNTPSIFSQPAASIARSSMATVAHSHSPSLAMSIRSEPSSPLWTTVVTSPRPGSIASFSAPQEGLVSSPAIPLTSTFIYCDGTHNPDSVLAVDRIYIRRKDKGELFDVVIKTLSGETLYQRMKPKGDPLLRIPVIQHPDDLRMYRKLDRRIKHLVKMEGTYDVFSSDAAQSLGRRPVYAFNSDQDLKVFQEALAPGSFQSYIPIRSIDSARSHQEGSKECHTETLQLWEMDGQKGIKFFRSGMDNKLSEHMVSAFKMEKNSALELKLRFIRPGRETERSMEYLRIKFESIEEKRYFMSESRLG